VPLFAIHGRVANQPVELLIDTGSERTTLSLHSPAARALRSYRNYPALSPALSGESRAWVVLEVPVEVAGFRGEDDVVVTDDQESECAIDGALGMDVLAHCRVVVMRTGASIRCM
jgi:predicted aspartyl protease